MSHDESKKGEKEDLTLLQRFEHEIDIPRSLINDIPKPKVEWHKELLYGLFLFSEDDNDICVFDSKIKKRKRFLLPSEFSAHAMKKNRICTGPISLLPDILRNFPGGKEKMDSSKTSCVRNNTVSSFDENDLLRFGMAKFTKSSLNIESNLGRTFSSRDNERTPSSFSPCIIKYNEASLFAISSWAAQSQDTEEDPKAKQTCVTKYFPVPEKLLRKCRRCNFWGHYDNECDRMTNLDILSLSTSKKKVYLSSSTSNQTLTSKEKTSRASRNILASNKVSCPTQNCSPICGEKILLKSRLKCGMCENYFHFACVNVSQTDLIDEHWICSFCSNYESDMGSADIKVERYKQFTIEQSKHPFSHLQVEDKDGRFENASERLTKTVHGENSLLPGNLCWAKRSCTKGSFGKDKWWPAMVISVPDGRDNTRTQMLRTPFLVKFFSCKGGGRVRTSEVVSFVSNYKVILNDRLKNPEEPDHHIFMKALKEAKDASNYTLPFDPSKSINERTELLSKNDKNCAGDWEDAEVWEEDGIVILAKCDEKRTTSIEKENQSLPFSSEIRVLIKSRDISIGNEKQLKASYLKKVSEILLSHVQNIGSANEIDINSISLSPLPSSKYPLLGCVVTWSIMNQKDNDIKIDNLFELSKTCQVNMGKVIAVLESNDKALIHLLRSDIMSHLQNQKSIVPNVYSRNIKNLKKMIWIPVKDLQYVTNDLRKINYFSDNNTTEKSGAQTYAQNRGKSFSTTVLNSSGNEEGNQFQTSFFKIDSNQSLSLKPRAKKKGKIRTPSQKTLFLSDSEDDSYSSDSIKSSHLSDYSSSPLPERSDIINVMPTSPDNIHQAECILDERYIKLCGKMQKQYLVKWKGVNEKTWEPEKHILCSKLIEIFNGKKKDMLKSSQDYDNLSSLQKESKKNKTKKCPFCPMTFQFGQALGGHIRIHRFEPNYKTILASTKCDPEDLEPEHDVKDFICPFCGVDLKDGLSFGGHVRKHKNEVNYREVLNAARKARNKKTCFTINSKNTSLSMKK